MHPLHSRHPLHSLQAHSAARAAALTGTFERPGPPDQPLHTAGAGHTQASTWLGVALLLLCAASATTHLALRSHRPTQIMLGTLHSVAGVLQASVAPASAPATPSTWQAQAPQTPQAPSIPPARAAAPPGNLPLQ